ncbi:MAG TPA: 2-amino-4-hydroxy-6-hydroxymethyldihydropteridine diphosphokinase [Steroidobacteraceae bacterium]|nr:2-amino-4-hydroxy-6-hydroxymethyldihydropteridine diphosphokinase [Steroidobacteraceae bacterium]
MTQAPGAARAASTGRWVPAYVALGSNLDDPRRQVERALDALAELPDTRLVVQSHLYRSRPMGPVAQPDFVNAVAGLLTRLDAVALLHELKSLESRLGRAAPVVRWGPRRIDLDLLVHGTTRMQQESIQVPHPGIAERAFVVVPLGDISPSLEVPGVGRVSALLRRHEASGLERIER